MTFDAIADEIVALRFDEPRRASVKNWINTEYATIWGKEDWYFKHVHGVALAVTTGNPTPTMPSDFGQLEGLYDANRNQIDYLDPIEWRSNYENLTTTGVAEAYTIINRQPYIGPIPSGNQTLTLDYIRRVSCVNAAGNVVGGVMSADSDEPIWEAEYDYVLVYGAAIRGGSLLGDLDVASMQQGRDEILETMRKELVVGESGERRDEWGALYGEDS